MLKMALHLAMWVIVSLIFIPHLSKSTRDETIPRRSIGKSHENQTSLKHLIRESAHIGIASHKSWSMPMIQVEDYKVGQKSGQNKSATQQWEEMVQQSYTRLAFLNHQSNRLVGIEAWDLPRLVRSQVGTYVVEIEMGSPPQATTFLVDTGSYFTWMQCEPCNPRMNSPHNPYPVATQGSFANWIKCEENMCQELGIFRNCDPNRELGKDCAFHMTYRGGSETAGRMGIDTINYNNNGVAKSKAIHLGMASEVHDIIPGHDGILGLSRSPLGLSFQLESEFDNIFSHCIVNSNSGRTNKFTMGSYPYALSQHLAYTPMEDPIYSMNHFYYVTLQAILVGSEDLGIEPSVFAQDVDSGTDGTVIDSGSILTFIPEVAYTAVVEAYRHQVQLFPVVSNPPLYSFCFDISLSFSDTQPILPDLTFKFANGVDLVVTLVEAFKILEDDTLLCLAMNSRGELDPGVNIIGSTFMQNQYVVYDNRHNTIGFAPWNCLSV